MTFVAGVDRALGQPAPDLMFDPTWPKDLQNNWHARHPLDQNRPGSGHDLFFPEMHGAAGS